MSNASGGLGSLVKNRTFVTVQIANFVSRFGDSIDAIAFAWLVYGLTGSTLLMGAVFAVNALPNIVFAPFSGVFADHFRKQTTVVLCHLGRGALVATGALLYLTGHLEVWMLFVLTFLISTLETFAVPAHGALAVHLVEKDQLAEAQGLAGSFSTAAQLLGLGAAGVLIAWLGVGGAILLDGLLFAAAGAVTALARIPSDTRRPGPLNRTTWWSDLKEGLGFIASQRPLIVALFLAMFANFAFSPLNVLEAAYVKDILGAGPEVLSAIGIALLVGMMAGGLLAGGAARRWGTWPVVFWGFAGVGAGYALIALPGLVPPDLPLVPLAVAAYLLTGFLLPFINAPLFGWLSATVDPGLQGRVFAVLNAFCLMASPLGAAASGAVALWVPIPWLFVSMGVLVVLVSLVAQRVVEEGPPS